MNSPVFNQFLKDLMLYLTFYILTLVNQKGSEIIVFIMR